MNTKRKVNYINRYSACDKETYLKTIKKEYLTKGKSLKELSEKMGISRSTITRWLRQDGVEITPPGEAGKAKSKIYDYKEDFFEEITENNQAYILGFILGDGCVNDESKRKRLKIDLAQKDESLLIEIAKELNAEELIKIRKSTNKNWQNKVSLVINSTKMCNDLAKWGVRANKTGNEEFVRLKTNELTWSYIRGIFDADGCVVKYSDTRRKFNIVGGLGLLDNIRTFFNEEGIHTSERCIYPKKGCYSLDVWKGDSTRKIFKKMYADGGIKLKRKYDKFL